MGAGNERLNMKPAPGDMKLWVIKHGFNICVLSQIFTGVFENRNGV